MTWLPNATVTVGGTAYTQDTLWGVSITYGRTSIWDQPRAGYANVEILNTDNSSNLFQVNDDLVIKIQDSSGADVTVFTGTVTDISNRVTASGEVGTVVTQTLTAVAPFAFMARKLVATSGYPKQYDDVRMLEILTEAGVTIDVVDTPGDYQFTAYAANPTDAYSLAAYFAQMGFGYIYETTDGKVGYANESHRLNEVQDFGYFVIPNSYVLAAGVSSNTTLNDLVNSILISYKANATKTASDPTSIALYGLQSGSVATELEHGTEAQYQADRYIATRAFPQTSLSSFKVQLNTNFITSADLDVFLGMYMGKPIQLNDLPTPIIPNVYQGFVEGWNLTFDEYQAVMTLTTSDATLSITPTRWQDVSPSQRWSDVGATIAWYEYA